MVIKKFTLRKVEAKRFYLWIALGLVGMGLFMIGPIVYSLFMSFNEWPVVRSAHWVGLRNYKELLGDERFWQSLRVTFYFTALTIPTRLVIALGWALLLNQAIRGKGIFRAIFYAPSVTVGVALAIMWQIVYIPEVGLANEILRWFNLPPLDWIYSVKLVIPSITIIYAWLSGGEMVIFLAGLQNIPNQLYEAAIIDGAGNWRKFWSITLPLLTPTIFFLLVITIIFCLIEFTIPYVMTQGGPGDASLFYVLYVYRQAFLKLRMGYASALAWVLLIIIFILTWLVFKTSKRWVYYEA